MLDRIKIRALGGPLHTPNAMLLQKLCGDPGSMRTCIVLLKSEVAVLVEVRHDHGSQHLVDISLRSNTIPRPGPMFRKTTGPTSWLRLIPPQIMMLGPPQASTSCTVTDAEAVFVCKDDVPPLPPVPVPAVLDPLQSLPPVSCSQGWSPCWTAAA